VTQRMLTRTLRQLERDGLIARRDHHAMPPRVDYTLTPLGRGLLVGMMPLWAWVIDNAEAFRAARKAFDVAPPAEAGRVHRINDRAARGQA
jgi:DNA-binding HxlR family transcriptional regulator